MIIQMGHTNIRNNSLNAYEWKQDTNEEKKFKLF